jgi:hypothetical protein
MIRRRAASIFLRVLGIPFSTKNKRCGVATLFQEVHRQQYFRPWRGGRQCRNPCCQLTGILSATMTRRPVRSGRSICPALDAFQSINLKHAGKLFQNGTPQAATLLASKAATKHSAFQSGTSSTHLQDDKPNFQSGIFIMTRSIPNFQSDMLKRQ